MKPKFKRFRVFSIIGISLLTSIGVLSGISSGNKTIEKTEAANIVPSDGKYIYLELNGYGWGPTYGRVIICWDGRNNIQAETTNIYYNGTQTYQVYRIKTYSDNGGNVSWKDVHSDNWDWKENEVTMSVKNTNHHKLTGWQSAEDACKIVYFDKGSSNNGDVSLTYKGTDMFGKEFESKMGDQYGDQVMLTATPNTGYEFASFNIGGVSKLTNNPYGFHSGHQIADNLGWFGNINATFSPKNYTVQFSMNGKSGTAPSDATVAYGGTVTKPNDPTSTGYKFDGWYKESACTNKWNFTTDTISGNTTLYAKWTTSSYSITYNNLQGTTTSNPTSYNIETATFTLSNPTARTHYSFLGWYTSLEGGTKVTQITKGSTGDKTFYAHWQQSSSSIIVTKNANVNSISLTYTPVDSSSQTTISDANGTYEAKINTSYSWVATASEGYSLDQNSGSGTVSTSDINISPTAALESEHIVSFSLNGKTGTTPESQNVKAGEKATRPLDPQDSGNYRFVDWYDNSECTGTAFNFDTVITRNFTLYAKWAIKDGFYLRVNSKGFNEDNQLKLEENSKKAGEYMINGVSLVANDYMKAIYYLNGSPSGYISGTGYVGVNSVHTSFPFDFPVKISQDNDKNAVVEKAGTYSIYIQPGDNFGAAYLFEPDIQLTMRVGGGDAIPLTRYDDGKGTAVSQWRIENYHATAGAQIIFYLNNVLHTVNNDSGQNNNIVMNDGLRFSQDTVNTIYLKVFEGEAFTAFQEFKYGTISSGENIYINDENTWINNNEKVGVYFYDNDNHNVWADGFANEIKYSDSYLGKTRCYFEITVPSLKVSDSETITTWNYFIVVQFNKNQTTPNWVDKIKQSQNMAFKYDGSRLFTTNSNASSCTFNNGFTDEDRANCYAYCFDKTACPLCNASDTASRLNAVWKSSNPETWTLSKEFNQMGSGAQTIFREYVSSSDEMYTLNHAVNLYDYVTVQKYYLDDFANRVPESLRGYAAHRGSRSLFSTDDNDSSSTVLIIVISSVSLLTLAGASLLIIKKRKTK